MTPPYRDVLWDDYRENLPDTRRILFTNYANVELWLYRNAATTLLSRDAVCNLHRMLFYSVFPLSAGHFRHAGTGFDVPITYSEIAAPHYRDLPELLTTWSRTVRLHIGDLDRFLDEFSPDRHVEEVVTAAAYAHCELTRLHPFLNGKGRTARTCINYYAYRYGLLPLCRARPC